MSVIKDMVRLADSLDRKGLRKEADDLDRIINKISQEMVMPGAATEQIMAGKTPEKVPPFVESKLGPDMKMVKKNPGDPFDYAYNLTEDYFQIVKAPYRHMKSLNAKLTFENNPKVYKILMGLNPHLASFSKHKEFFEPTSDSLA